MKIVIDPGHGGKDSGAVGNGLREKDITLDIALKLRDKLAAYADVSLTRGGDSFITLADRAAVANSIGADCFVSIHVNAGGSTGFESYIYTKGLRRSRELQKTVHNEVAAFYMAQGLPDRGMKQANFAVLRETTMPAVLLENLFIDTDSDAVKLKDPAFRDKAAGAIASGVVKAFNLQGNIPPPPPPHWAIKDFQRLVDAGLVTGQHNLDANVTWGQMSAVLARLLDELGL